MKVEQKKTEFLNYQQWWKEGQGRQKMYKGEIYWSGAQSHSTLCDPMD